MSPDKRSPEELLAAIEEMEMRDAAEELDAMSDDEIARAIEKDGGDAKAIGARGAALAASLIQRRKDLQWQVEAREKIEAGRAKIAAMPPRPRLTRDEMKRRIDEARRDATFATALAARKGGTEEATDDELADLLEQLDVLRQRRDEK